MSRSAISWFCLALSLLSLINTKAFGQTVPTITSFTPTSGLTGAVIAVSGTGFAGATGAAVNGINAVYAVQNDSLIDICVPSDTSSGPIAVTTPGGTATSSTSFTLLAGVGIGDISPDDGATGQSINIYGDDFNGVTSVTFGGVPAAFTYVNWYRIIAIVPQGFSSGTVTVTTPQGAATSWQSFTVYSPIITAISPNSGSAGTVINLTGTGFTGVTAASVGGVSAPFSVVSSTSVNVTAPTGVISGPVSLTAHGFSTTSAANFIVATPSFLLSTSTPASTIGQNSIATSIISLTNEDGFTGSVALSISGLPSGVSASFSPSTISGSTVSTLTLTSNSSITAGSDFLIVTGTSGSMVETVPIDFISTATNSTLTAVEVAPPTASISTPGTQQFTATGLDQFGNVLGTQPTFTWTLETSPVGSISSTGLYTASAVGTDTVTATSGSLHASATTTVTEGPPTITSFTPTSGTVGTVIAVTGTNLAGATAVTVNGIGGVIVVQSNTLADVVATGSTGPIRITTPEGTATSPTNFTVLPGVGIAQINPNSGAILQRTNIWGQFFSGVNGVSFNGVPAAFTFINADNVTAIVPPGATSGPVTIATPTGSAIAWPSFTVVGPIISSISPASGSAGAVVTLTGTGLTSASSASIGGVSASLTVVSSTDAIVTVPSGAVTGPVCLTSSYGTCASPTAFTVPVPSFTISTTPAMFTLGAGTTGTITLNVANIDGFSSNVSVTVSGLPAGVTATVSPSTLSGSGTATLTLTAAPSITTAFTTLTVTVTSGSLVQTTPVCLATVTSSTLTSIALSPVAASIPSGSTQQFMATGLDQFGNALATQPTFTWTAAGGGTISSAGVYTATTPGTGYTVKAACGSISGTASTSVTTFTVGASPSSVSVGQGQTGFTNISLNNLDGFASYVALTVSGLPVGVTASFSPSTIAGTTVSQLLFTVSPTAAAGTTTVTVTGACGSLTETETVALTVTANQVLTSIVVSPSAAELIYGETEQFSAQADDQHGNAMALQPSFYWFLAGLGDGSITGAGLYTAPAISCVDTVEASADGISGSAIVTVSASTVPPSPPTNLVAGPVASSSEITLHWYGVTSATSYNVYRGTSAGSESSTPYATLVDSGSSSGQPGQTWTDTSASSGTTYFYAVTAVSSIGEGARSNETSAVSGGAPLAAPSDVVAKLTGGVSVYWAVESGASSYVVYRLPGASGTAAPIAINVTGNSYVDSSAVTGETYVYSVAGVDAVGQGRVSAGVYATPGNYAPPAPSYLTASPGQSGISLSWGSVSSAVTYNLYRSTASGVEGSVPYLTGLSNSFYTDSSVTSGTTYYYKVTAVNQVGEGSASNEASATAGSTPLPAPAAISAIESSQVVNVNWAPVTGAASYDIFRSVSGAEMQLYQSGLTSASFTDSGLTNGIMYTYSAAGVNANGLGNQSIDVTAVPGDIPLPAPTGLTATGTNNDQIGLTWQTVAGAQSYNVYRSTSAGGEGAVPIATGGADITRSTASYTDSSVTATGTYYYRVSAVDPFSGQLGSQNPGESPMSNEASAVADVVTGGGGGNSPSNGPFPAPTGLAVSPSGSVLNLTWNPVPGATWYEIFRATTSGGEGGTPYKTQVNAASAGLEAYTDSSDTSGTTYYYEVAAYAYEVNPGPGSAEASGTAGAAQLSAPAAITAHPLSGEVALIWSSVNGATSYNLYRTDDLGNLTAYEIGLTTCSFVDSGLTNGGTYSYYVAAATSAGQGVASATVYAVPGSVLPQAPAGLVAGATGTSSIELTWDPVPGAITYNIYRATSPGGEGATPIKAYIPTPGTTQGAQSSVNGQGEETYTDSPPVAGTIYYYTVTAVTFAGEGPQSNEASAGSGATELPAPSIIKAVPESEQVTVEWTPVTNATGYDLYRSVAGGPFLLYQQLTSTTYVDSGLTNGTLYGYFVLTVSSAGVGVTGSINVAYAIPGDYLLDPPQDLQGQWNGTNSVALSWLAPVGAGSGVTYNIYRGATPGGEGAMPMYADVFGTNANDGAVLPDTYYYYYVTAVTPVGESNPSNEICVETGGPLSTGIALVPVPPSLSLSPGQDEAVDIEVYAAPNFSGPVNFTVTGMPAGINAFCYGTSNTIPMGSGVGAGADLWIYATQSAIPGRYVLTLTGTSGQGAAYPCSDSVAVVLTIL